MKKVSSFIRNILLMICIVCLFFLVKDTNMFWINISLIFFITFIVIYILGVLLKIESNCFIDGIFMGFIYVLVFLNFPKVSKNEIPVYDLNTEIGQLQQEIYEQSGVYTFYNVDVKDKADIVYIDDYHVSEDEVLNSLKEIKEVLAFYSNGFPKEIYIINSFVSGDKSCNGIYIRKSNIIVLKEQENISSTLHHEMGHSIEDKTYNLISLIKFKSVNQSCELVSDYACTSNDELFAEAWRNTIVYNKITEYSLALSNIFKDNLKGFENPYYVDFLEVDEAITKLINNEIDSFIVKGTVGKVFMTYSVPSNISFLDVGDEVLFYLRYK